jgi:hypothetical protein
LVLWKDNIYKSLAKLKERKKTQINKIRDEKQISQVPRTFKRSLENMAKKLHSNELENLEEIDKFLDTCNLTKLNKEDIND